MLTELQKSPTSFDSFEKGISLRSRPRDGIMREEARQLGRTSRKKRLIASNLPPSSERWISIAHEVIALLTLPRPSRRLHLLGIPKTRLPPPPKRLGTSPYTPRIHISRGPRMARLLIKRLGKRRRGNSVVEMLSKVERALPPTPVSTCLAPPVGLVPVARILPRSPASTAKRKVIMR